MEISNDHNEISLPPVLALTCRFNGVIMLFQQITQDIGRTLVQSHLLLPT